MKKIVALSLSLLIVLLCFAACKKEVSDVVWEDAKQTENTVYGTGAKSIKVEVKAADKSVTLTVNTDKATLGEALLEHNIISGEQGQYGLYVKVVNGITADYDVDGSYWAVYKNGEYCMSGVDSTPIADGEHYEFVYTK